MTEFSSRASMLAQAVGNERRNGIDVLPDSGFSFRLNEQGYRGNNGLRDNVASFVSQYMDKHKDPASDIKGMPPLFGQDVLPHAMTFQSLIGSYAKTYLPADEALEANPNDAAQMLKNVGIRECLQIRQFMVALTGWSIQPENSKSPAQKSLAAMLTKCLQRIRRFTEYRRCMQAAIWSGKSAIQHRYGNEVIDGQALKIPKPLHQDDLGWKHIHGDKIVFRYDDGREFPPGAFPDQMGIRVSAAMRGNARRRGLSKVEATNSGSAYFLSPAERSTILCHKHMIEDAEFTNPRKAGRIHGIGIRDMIYNEWFLYQEILGFVLEYAERSAGGIEIWEYPSGDDKAKASIMEAAKNRMSNGRNQLFFPKPLGMEAGVYDLRIVEPGFAGIETMLGMADKYFGHRIKRLILGQTLTTEADATGMGTGVADAHRDTLSQIIRYDIANHDESVTEELVKVIQLENFPETECWKMRFVSEIESDDVQKKMEGYQAAFEMGLGIPEKDVAQCIGISLDNPNEKLLKKAQEGMGMPGMPGMGGAGNGMQFPSHFQFQSGQAAQSADLNAAMKGADHAAGMKEDQGKAKDEVLGKMAPVEEYSRQLTMTWTEEDEKLHPRDEAGRFTERDGGNTSTLPAETPEPKNVGPAGLSKSEAIQKAKKGGTGLLTHAEAVSATMLYLGTGSGDWSAVPVEGMVEVQDASGKARTVPQFSMPKDYKPIETPWTASGAGGEFCCELCATPIKNAFHIQNDEKKWLMTVGSECVTKFGDGMSGEQLAKRDMQRKRRNLVKVTHEAIRGFAEKIKAEKDGRNLTLQDVAKAIGNDDSRKRFWRVAKSLGIDPYSTQWRIEKDGVVHENDFKHLDGFSTREKSTDQKIGNWHKKNSDDAEMMLKDLKRFGVDVPDKYSRQWTEEDEKLHPRNPAGADGGGRFTSNPSAGQSVDEDDDRLSDEELDDQDSEYETDDEPEADEPDEDELAEQARQQYVASLPTHVNAVPRIQSTHKTPVGEYRVYLKSWQEDGEAQHESIIMKDGQTDSEFWGATPEEALADANEAMGEILKDAEKAGQVEKSGQERSFKWSIYHDGKGGFGFKIVDGNGEDYSEDGYSSVDDAEELLNDTLEQSTEAVKLDSSSFPAVKAGKLRLDRTWMADNLIDEYLPDGVEGEDVDQLAAAVVDQMLKESGTDLINYSDFSKLEGKYQSLGEKMLDKNRGNDDSTIDGLDLEDWSTEKAVDHALREIRPALMEVVKTAIPGILEQRNEDEGNEDEDSEPEKYQRRSHRLLNEAASQTALNPTPAQIEAGNYSKGVYSWKGLEIAIENPKGSTRSGVSASGRKWERVMACHYGYFRRTKANDGDALDVYIGGHPDSEFVLVIKQIDQGTREFDEFKVVVGCLNRKEAKRLYLANYPAGWKCGPMADMTVGLFKKWVEKGGPMREKSVNVEKYEREFEPDDSDEKSTLIAEILQHFFGDSVGEMLDAESSESSGIDRIEQYRREEDVDFYSWVRHWNESDYVRVPKGESGGGRFAKKGSAENTAAIHSAIDSELKSGKKSPESAKRLADHLSQLTVKELHELKKKYGVSASGVKAELIEKIAKRLDSGRRADQSKNPEPISNSVDNKIDGGEQKVDTPDVGRPLGGAAEGSKKDQGKNMIIDRAEGKGHYRRYEFDGVAIVAAWPMNNMQGRKVDESKVVRPSELKGEVRKAWIAAMKAFDGKSFNWEATAEEVAAAPKFVKIEVRQASSVGGYAKPFVAKIVGYSPNYRLDREFVEPENKQHGGTWVYNLTEDGIYHVCDRNSKGAKREHFLKIENGVESSMTREEVEALFPVPEVVEVNPVDPVQPGKKEFEPENPIHRAQAAANLAADECKARGIEKDTDPLYLRAVLTFWNLIQERALQDDNTRASFEAAEQQIKFGREWKSLKGQDWTPADTITLEELKSIYSN